MNVMQNLHCRCTKGNQRCSQGAPEETDFNFQEMKQIFKRNENIIVIVSSTIIYAQAKRFSCTCLLPLNRAGWQIPTAKLTCVKLLGHMVLVSATGAQLRQLLLFLLLFFLPLGQLPLEARLIRDAVESLSGG